jgi:uncharacterized protein (DUF3820 family)
MKEVYTDNTFMPFGKYLNRKLIDVPADYLMWCYQQENIMRKWPQLKEYIEENKSVLCKELGIKPIR